MSDTITPGQNFEDAFAQFLSDTPPAAQPETQTDAQDTIQAPAEPPAPGGSDTIQAPAEGDTIVAGNEGQDTPPGGQDTIQAPAETPPASNEDVLARLAGLLKTAPATDKPATQPEPATEPPIYSEEENKFLADYVKEWPDVSKAEQLIRRGEYRAMVGYVFQEVAKELRPVMELVHSLADRTQHTDLVAAVPDYEAVREKVIDWVGKQPSYLQPAYQHVIEKGTSEEVADLIGRYKRDTGVAEAPKPSAPAARTKTELPPATKQAAAALAPVGSKRSAVPQMLDPQNFDQAFAEFADKV